MRTLPALLALVACGPRRAPQTLADLGGHVVLDVPLPPEADGVGAAFFEGLVADAPAGRSVAEPRLGVTLWCRVDGRGHVEVRALLDGAVLDARSGAIDTDCGFGDPPLPVVIRW